MDNMHTNAHWFEIGSIVRVWMFVCVDSFFISQSCKECIKIQLLLSPSRESRKIPVKTFTQRTNGRKSMTCPVWLEVDDEQCSAHTNSKHARPKDATKVAANKVYQVFMRFRESFGSCAHQMVMTTDNIEWINKVLQNTTAESKCNISSFYLCAKRKNILIKKC